MKNLKLLVAALVFFNVALIAQDAPKFTVEVSSDSVLMGNYFEVKFTLENASGQDFESPAFADFNIVGGPNQSSSFSMVNGQVSQSLAYTYYLEPKSTGNFYIEPASIKVKDNILETPPVAIIAVPNPDGIIQNPNQGELRQSDFWEPLRQPQKPVPPKKKRKIYRM